MAAGTGGTTPHSTQFVGTSKTPTEGRRSRKSKGKGRTPEKSVAMAATANATAQEKGDQKDTKPPRVRAVDQRLSPMHIRKGASENYEEPASGREGWWRCHIRETPNPGSYEPGHFLDEVLRRQNTYSFKSDGRRLDPQPQIGRGESLLPGAYEHHDFLQRFDKFNTTYGFKGTSREERDYLNFGKKDKDINVCPTAYELEKYGSVSVDKQPSSWVFTTDGNIIELPGDNRHWQFKSQSHRFPTIYFKPKDGPAPGNYDYTAPPPEKPVRSAFLSKTPRFASSHTRVPGPGSYDKTFQAPMPKTIMKMGRNHGLFFSSAFQA